MNWNSSINNGECNFINSKAAGTGGFTFHNVSSNTTNSSVFLAKINSSGQIICNNVTSANATDISDLKTKTLYYCQQYFWRGILDSTNSGYATKAHILSAARQSVGYYMFTINSGDGNAYYHVSVDVIKNNTATLANEIKYFVTNKTQYTFFITLMTTAGALCDVDRTNGGYLSVIVTSIVSFAKGLI